LDTSKRKSRTEPPSAARRGAPVRISAFYCALFLGLGIFLPFFPVWLGARGLSALEISLVLGAQTAARLVAGPALAYVSDRLRSRREVIAALAVGTLAGTVAMSQAEGFWELLALGIAASAAWTPIMPLIETVAVAESEAGGADYGRMRLWGSLSFIAGSLGAGHALQHIGAQDVIWLLIAADALLVAAAFALPRAARPSAPAPGMPRIRMTALLPLLRHPAFLAFMLAASLIQASHAVYYVFSALHWQALGIGEDAIGLLWSVGVVTEVSLFLFARRAVSAVGPLGLVAIGGIAALARWSATALDPGLAWLLVVQAAHGLTFGATHLGSMHFIARIAPPALHASVQGAYAAFSGGIVMALAMAASGPLYAAHGGGAFLAMAGLGAVGAAAALVARAHWSGERIGG
jgi:PPP family 3-phenylpropionic acid transporter